MTMTNQQYWERRHLQTKANQLKNIEDYERALQPQLNKLYHELDSEMQYWVSRYAENQAIEPLEARKLLRNVNTKHWELTLKQFEEKARAGGHESELDAEYFKSRVARLQDLERQLQQTAMPYAKDTQKSLGNALVGQYDDTYMRTTFNIQAQKAKFTSNFARFSNNQMKIAVSMPWAKDGKDFSSRVWKDYTKELPSYLMDSVLRGTLLGYSPQRISKMFHARFQDAKRNDIHRLVISEMAHVAEEANAASYEENEIDQYEYMATLESHTCSICGHLDGQVFTTKERRPGVNYPTIHSRCRCTTVPSMEGLPDMNSRWYRDPETGKGKLTRNMKFDEWKRLVNSGKPMPEVTPVKPKAQPIDPLDANQWPKGIQVFDSLNGKMVKLRAPNGRSLGSRYLDEVKGWTKDDVVDQLGSGMDDDNIDNVVKWIQDIKKFGVGEILSTNKSTGKYTADLLRPKPLTDINPDTAQIGTLRNYIEDEFGMQLKETSRTRLSETAIRETAKTVGQFKDIYQALPNKIPSLRAVPVSEAKSAIAWYSHTSVTNQPVEFGLNVKYFKDKDSLTEMVKRNVDNGFFSKNANSNHVMVHEFSHHLDFQLSKLADKSFSSELFKRMRVDGNEITPKFIGKYADDSYHRSHNWVEPFAEMMTEAYGPTPRKEALQFKEYFEKLALEVLNDA